MGNVSVGDKVSSHQRTVYVLRTDISVQWLSWLTQKIYYILHFTNYLDWYYVLNVEFQLQFFQSIPSGSGNWFANAHCEAFCKDKV